MAKISVLPESFSLSGTQDPYTAGGNDKGNFNNLEINQHYNIFGNFQLLSDWQAFKIIAHFSLVETC